jgi:ribosomal silencing factor RsfS
MFDRIVIGRFKHTGQAGVIDNGVIVSIGSSAQNHAFANNVERTLREKGLELEVTTLETKYGGEMTKCKETT